MKFDVDVDGAESIVTALTAWGEEMSARAAEGMKAGLLCVERKAKELCPFHTGELRSSIYTQVNATPNGAEGKVSAAKEYAVYVEMGTGQVGKASGGNGSGKTVSYRTGGWFVPVGRSEEMIADTVVQAASKGFWTYGQPARPYLYPAFKGNKKKIVAAIRKAIAD